jgi:hypothetical protein
VRLLRIDPNRASCGGAYSPDACRQAIRTSSGNALARSAAWADDAVPRMTRPLMLWKIGAGQPRHDMRRHVVRHPVVGKVGERMADQKLQRRQ